MFSETFFTIFSCFLVTIVLFSEWHTSNGKLHVTYTLNSIKFFGFLILETALGLNDPSQKAILLFNIANLWGFVMNLKGLYRLYKQNQLIEKNRKDEESIFNKEDEDCLL